MWGKEDGLEYTETDVKDHRDPRSVFNCNAKSQEQTENELKSEGLLLNTDSVLL